LVIEGDQTMQEDDLTYFRRRAREEAARALSITDSVTAAVHRELAVAYRLRVSGLADHAPRL
jgi:hypothetical protein